MSAEDAFLSRWAKRKALARSGTDSSVDAAAGKVAERQEPTAAAPASLTAVAAVLPVETRSGQASLPKGSPAATAAPAHDVEPAPLPTMADVAQLSRTSDFSSFVRPGVDPSVSNAAMKKLFSDPRYNVMDGLDTYIGDYNTPDPIPFAMLRQMNQAAFLGLFDDEVEAGHDGASEKPPEQACAPAVSGTEPPTLTTSLQAPALDRTCEPAAVRIRADDDTDL